MKLRTASSKDIETLVRNAYKQLNNANAVYAQLKGKGVTRDQVRKIVGVETNFDFDVSPVVDSAIPIGELHRRKAMDFERLKANHLTSAIRTIRVKSNDPIGISWLGDTHLDDDGCNIKRVLEDAAIIRKTKGLKAVSVGDHLNLWVGRLFKLYAEQTTKRSDGYRLLQDFIVNQIGLENWLALIFGNHDIWAQDGLPPLEWAQNRGIVVGKYNVRLRLLFPNGREVYVWLRHDFPGNSQWNDLHGLTKQALTGSPNHIYVAGHKHTFGHHEEYNETTGIYWHAIRVGSYKEIDEYPEELNLKNKNTFQAPVTIIDPKATNEMQLIKFEPDLADGADRLTWMRKKAA